MSEEITKEAKEAVKYEVMAIISPDVTTVAYKKHVDEIKHLIESHKGSVWHEEEWGKRELAYNIKKHDHGYYVVFNFDMPSEETMEFQKQLRLMGVILRFLVVKTPEGFKPQKYNFEEAEAKKGAKEVEEEKPKKATPMKRVAKATVAATVVKEIPAEEVEEAEEIEEKVAPQADEEEVEEVAEKEEAAEKPKKVMSDKESTERLNKLDAKLEELLSGDDDLNL